LAIIQLKKRVSFQLTYMENERALLATIATASILALTACGGGGNDDSEDGSSSAGETYQLKAAVGNLQTSTKSWTVSGKGQDGKTYTVSYSKSAAAPGVFALTGNTEARVVNTSTLKRDGVTFGTGTSTTYFDADFTPIGADFGSDVCALATRSTAFPVSAKVGDVGASIDATIHAGCSTSGSIEGYVKGTWSVERDRGVTLLCFNSTVSDASHAKLYTGSDCAEIGTAGEVGDRARLTFLVQGHGMVTARNY
jgi:hypothetical protein